MSQATRAAARDEKKRYDELVQEVASLKKLLAEAQAASTDKTDSTNKQLQNTAKFQEEITQLQEALENARYEAEQAISHRRLSIARDNDDPDLKLKCESLEAELSKVKTELLAATKIKASDQMLGSQVAVLTDELEKVRNANVKDRDNAIAELNAALGELSSVKAQKANMELEIISLKNQVKQLSADPGSYNNAVTKKDLQDIMASFATQMSEQKNEIIDIINAKAPAETIHAKERLVTYASVVNANKTGEIKTVTFNENIDEADLQDRLRADENCAHFRLKTKRKRGGFVLIGKEAELYF